MEKGVARKPIMKNKIIQTLLNLFVLVLMFGFGTAGLSLGQQDTWLNIYPYVYDSVLKTKERVVVDLNNNRRVDYYIDSSTREVLLKKYYSACTGSRLIIDDDLFLRVSDGAITKEYSLSLFETLPSPRDNYSYVLQGNLDVRYSKNEKYDNYFSSYSKLSENNSIYIPSSLADNIKTDFSILEDKNIVIEDEKTNLLKYEIINSTNNDDIINVECKVRGIFQSEASLGKTINSLGSLEENFSSTAICSPYFFSSFPHLTSRLIIFMKYNSTFDKNNDMVKGFSSAMQYAFKKSKLRPKCIASNSEETTAYLNSIFDNYYNSFVLKYNYLFIIIGASFYIGLYVFIFLEGKLSKDKWLFLLNWKYLIAGMGMSFLISIGILRIINIIVGLQISILSTYGLFISVVLFVLSLFITLLCFIKKHNQAKVTSNLEFNVLNNNNYYLLEI